MKKITLLSLSLLFCFSLLAQKKALTVDDFDNWNHIHNAQLSQDGKWMSYEVNPFKGDGKLHIENLKSKKKFTFARGTKAKIAADASFFVFSVKPEADSVRALQLKKVKKDKLPKDTLAVWVSKNQKRHNFPKYKSFKLGEDSGNWIAIHVEKEKKKKEKEKSEEQEDKKKSKKPKTKDKNAPKTAKLILFNPTDEEKFEYNNVSDYTISKNGELITFVQLQNDTITKSTVVTFDTKTKTTTEIFMQEGVAKKVELADDASNLAFIFSADTIKNKVYSLYFAQAKSKAKPLVEVGNKSLPENWSVSENGSIDFSKDGSKLYFGTALKPEPEKKDTLLDSEKVQVDIWHWQDLKLQPQQLHNLKNDQKKTYKAVYHISENKVVQLSSDFYDYLRTYDFGNANFGLLSNSKKYYRAKSWDISNGSDYYFVDFKTGEKKLLQKQQKGRSTISPNGKFYAFYSTDDKTWHTQEVVSGKTVKHEFPHPMYDEEDDYPENATAYGYAGWTTNDASLWVYDRFDIWEIDPTGARKPINITRNGRQQNIQYRYRKLNHEISHIDPKFVLLQGFNLKNKQDAYYKLGKKKIQKLIGGDYMLSSIRKAKEADQLIWTRSTFQEYPDYWYGDFKFKKPRKITDANPQQSEFNWGTAELFEWEVEPGKKEEGLLFKPENFDPNKKYPVVVYFYRLYSDLLYRHIRPKQSRSIINPTFYVSNEYIVFIPNIRFEIGHPGKSATKYVTSGAKALAKLPYIDGERMGIQGQSWGGYQVAHIVTETDMFRAAWAGAPVSNMTSAYGGIRWGSGMSRMFQYEKTQSRIGATLWEKPELYIENSPVFHAPKINTPLVIMHNDNDGAVPWYQGIELFVALRRLDKPAWMLNYNKQPHNLKAKTPNGKDLSIRLMQFFDHYLKGKPAPVWIKDGVPALMKGKTLGYETE